MKKLAFISMIAALFVGVPTTQAFDNNGLSVESEEVKGGEAVVNFDINTEILTLTLTTAGEKERVVVYISYNGELVASEHFVAAGRAQTFEMDLAGFEEGVYMIKVRSKTIAHGDRFKKK